MNYSRELSTSEIQYYAPSAFAASPYHAQSSRYAFIPTSAVIDGMRSAGFRPVMAAQSRCRIADKKDFTKHMIRFRASQSLTAQAIVGDSVLEAVLINSHDGTSAYKLMCGIFRFVCSNGMVVADSLLESIHIRHSGNVIDEVIAGSQRILESAPRVMETVNTWKQITLAPAEQHLLAEGAHSLRWPADEDGNPTTLIKLESLLQIRRTEDAAPNLWNTFNTIQERAINGFKTRERDANRRRVSARAVRGIDGNVNLNRALWTLAEKMAALKQAA